MYKVFINERPVILCSDPAQSKVSEDWTIAEVHSRKAMKLAWDQFFTSAEIPGILIYNNAKVKSLLKDFISMFRYLEAAGGMVRNTADERLFIHRFGCWDLPKGKLEKGETPAEAALREVAEETGIHHHQIIRPLSPSYHIYDHHGASVLKCTHWFAMNYSGNEPLVPQTEESITRAEWFAPHEINQVIENTYASLREVILEDLLI